VRLKKSVSSRYAYHICCPTESFIAPGCCFRQVGAVRPSAHVNPIVANGVLKNREDVRLTPRFLKMPLKTIATFDRLICAAVFPSFHHKEQRWRY
jgi:hypothetical protein